MSNKIVINGQNIFYEEYGDHYAPALVMVHGNSHSSRSFREQFADSRLNKYRLLAIDLPGHGDSARSEVYSVPFFAEVLAAFVKQMGLKNYLFVGHSLGGHIAVEALEFTAPKGVFIFGTPPLKNPIDMSSVLPCAELAYFFQETLSEKEAELLANSLFVDQRDTTIEREDFKKTDPHFKVSMAESIAKSYVKDEITLLQNYNGLKALVHGERDLFVNIEYLKNLSLNGLWRGDIVITPKGHNLHIEDAKNVNSLLADFACDAFQGQEESVTL